MVTKESGEYIRIAGGYVEVRQKLGAGTISASGKSKVLVSSGGFKQITGSDASINLVVITK